MSRVVGSHATVNCIEWSHATTSARMKRRDRLSRAQPRGWAGEALREGTRLPCIRKGCGRGAGQDRDTHPELLRHACRSSAPERAARRTVRQRGLGAADRKAIATGVDAPTSRTPSEVPGEGSRVTEGGESSSETTPDPFDSSVLRHHGIIGLSSNGIVALCRRDPQGVAACDGDDTL